MTIRTSSQRWSASVPLTPSDYFDRMAILMVKSHLVQHDERRAAVLGQLSTLLSALSERSPLQLLAKLDDALWQLVYQLLRIHLRQWALEDQVRREQAAYTNHDHAYLPREVILARLVHLNEAIRQSNRERTECRDAIDRFYGETGEPKEYANE